MARAPYPLMFEWDGDAMIPLNRFSADRMYVIGERYRLAVHEERSAASHSHYFAALHDAWTNLPHELAAEYPTPDHLRKAALIQVGYCDKKIIGTRSAKDAQSLLVTVKTLDEFALATADGKLVTIFTAKSQSVKAMGKDDFQASKQAVLEIVAALIGVTPEQLNANAGQAA